MNESTLNTLTQRLDRLERENRRLKIAGAILLLALAGVGVMGQKRNTSGPSLVLGDENRSRAVLGHTALEATATGTLEQRPTSSLVLFDKEGKVIWKAP